jgi:DNA-binding NtrC family response regulator
MKESIFISKSKEVQSIIKGLTLSKSLMVSSLIIGEAHTGKKTLVSAIFPKTPSIDANDIERVEKMLEEHSELIIYNFEAIKSIKALKIENRRIIAVANYSKISQSAKNHFAFIYIMPPLRKRPEDVNYFLENCSEDLREYLTIDEKIKIEVNQLDLSENFKT